MKSKEKIFYKVKILGSGNAFDVNETNSSFLIETNYKGVPQKILVDCGYNVFQYLRNNNIDINTVFVTHTHFDHIGSLESLVYYNYFIKGRQTRIMSGPKVIEKLKEIFGEQCLFENGEKIPSELIKWVTLDENENIPISTIEVNHIVTPCYGLVIRNTYTNNLICISGDTKASKRIVDLIEKEAPKRNNIIILHDYSEWDDAFRNIHCCRTDFKLYYEHLIEKFNNINFVFYHNNSNKGEEYEI